MCVDVTVVNLWRTVNVNECRYTRVLEVAESSSNDKYQKSIYC